MALSVGRRDLASVLDVACRGSGFGSIFRKGNTTPGSGVPGGVRPWRIAEFLGAGENDDIYSSLAARRTAHDGPGTVHRYFRAGASGQARISTGTGIQQFLSPPPHPDGAGSGPENFPAGDSRATLRETGHGAGDDGIENRSDAEKTELAVFHQTRAGCPISPGVIFPEMWEIRIPCPDQKLKDTAGGR